MEEYARSTNNSAGTLAGVSLFTIILLLAAAYFFPWRDIQWGNVVLAPAQLITVTGTASQQQENQIAQFTAGVSAVNDDKDKAIQSMNQSMEKMVTEIKNFGIDSQDIKTENLSIYQGEETYYDNGQPKQRPGQWRVSNSVSVKLRDIDRANALTKLLSDSGATNVYGPNFTLDAEDQPENALLGEAVENAKEKAEQLAQASGGKLGAVVSISEGSAPGLVGPVFARMESGGGGGGPSVEPGSALVTKQVSVTFELIRN